MTIKTVMPSKRASVETWRKYAAGLDPERAEHIATMTKPALVVQYGTVPPAPDKQIADPTPAPATKQQHAEPRHAAEPDPGHEPEVVDPGTSWARVMRDVGQIAKGDRNADQGFNFRGIDATMNAVGPAFRRHGVAVLPIKAEVLESERYESKRGAAMHGMVTRHDWLILGPDGAPMKYPDGSPIIMQTLGQAADTSDKVASKASSVAYRTALLQSLTVPTGDRDPDADSPERATAAAADPRQEQWDRIAELGRYARQSKEAIRKHYAEKMGHEIDGPDATVASLTEYADRLHTSLAEKAAAENKQAEQAPADPETTAAAAASEPPAAAPTPAPAETKPDPTPAPTPAQGRDPRQALWDDIMESGKRLELTAGQMRADFAQWALDAIGHEAEIDGPEATSDLLTRYAHTLKGR